MTKDQIRREQLRQMRRVDNMSDKEAKKAQMRIALLYGGLGASVPLIFGANATAIYKHIKRYHKAKAKYGKAKLFNRSGLRKMIADSRKWKNIGPEAVVYASILSNYVYQKEGKRRIINKMLKREYDKKKKKT